jgi:pimeloyl-ACP methyl ester carboxylesterase
MAQFLEDVCDALDLTDVDLVANDTGGARAQVDAAARPERLRTFVLTTCDAHDNIPPEAFKPTVELATQGLLAPAAAELMANIEVARDTAFGATFEHPEKLDLDLVRAFLDPVLGTDERAVQFQRVLTSLDAADLMAAEPGLKGLDVPTLIVWGASDQFFDVSWAYRLRDTIPGATKVIEIPEGRLFFPEERPAELAAALREFWSGTQPATENTPQLKIRSVHDALAAG